MSNNNDPTETIRRAEVVELNADQRVRQELEVEYGQCWNTDELQRDFQVLGFMAPYVVVERKSDGIRGSIQFRHSPRLYFNWSAD